MFPAGGATYSPAAPPVMIIDLEGVAGKVARIVEVNGGGEVTATGAMTTRLARDTAVGTGARTAVSIAKDYSNDPTSDFFLSSAYATTAPTVDTPSLLGFGWNAHGGGFRWKAGPDEGFFIVGAISAQMRADAGTSQSRYGIRWREY